VELSLGGIQKVSPSTYEIVAMVITFLAPHTNLDLIISGLTSSLQEVLWKELSLLVEVIAGTLSNVTMS
jgi:hypothetical protein